MNIIEAMTGLLSNRAPRDLPQDLDSILYKSTLEKFWASDLCNFL